MVFFYRFCLNLTNPTRIDERVPEGAGNWSGCQNMGNNLYFLGKLRFVRNRHFGPVFTLVSGFWGKFRYFFVGEMGKLAESARTSTWATSITFLEEGNFFGHFPPFTNFPVLLDIIEEVL